MMKVSGWRGTTEVLVSRDEAILVVVDDEDRDEAHWLDALKTG